MNWTYLTATREQVGPLGMGDMLAHIAQGKVTADTLVWTESMGDKWLPASEAPTLSQLPSLQRANADFGSNREAVKMPSESEGIGEGGDGVKGRETARAAAAALGDTEEKELGGKSAMGRRRKRQKKEKPPVRDVYVRGVPDDAEVGELHEHFSKCGIIRVEPIEQQPKIKLYTDEQGKRKGDALVCYLRAESVALAEQMLDGVELRPGVVLQVEAAVFDETAGGGKKARRKKRRKQKKQEQGVDAALLGKMIMPSQERALSWADEEEDHPQGLRVVVLMPMFTLEEAESDARGQEMFYDELKLEVGAECERLGRVEKVTVFGGNPLGPVLVRFAESSSAVKCIDTMHGRFFSGRKIKCFFHDGETSYKVRESEADQEKRLEDFGKWLEGEGDEGGEA